MELVDLYDENRLPLGKTAERSAPKGPGELRLVVTSASLTAGGGC